jgi:hypothetical protein
MDSSNINTSSTIVLNRRPLSVKESERYNTTYLFEVTNTITNIAIPSDRWTHAHDDVYTNVMSTIVEFSSFVNEEVAIVYKYYDDVDKEVITTTETFELSGIPEESNIELYNLYTDAETAGVVDSLGNLNLLGNTIVAELKSVIKLKWGTFNWNWDPWDFVGVFNRENILIKPLFDASIGGFNEYYKLS